MKKELKLQRWGNSLGIRIPSSITQEMGWSEGTNLVAEAQADYIVLKRNEVSLDELIQEIRPDNCHAVTDTGNAKGREVW